MANVQQSEEPVHRIPFIGLTAALLAAGAIAGCGSSTSATSSSVTTTPVAQAQVASTAQTRSASTAQTTSASTAQTTSAFQPSAKTKGAIVELCRLDIRSQRRLSATKKEQLEPLCVQAVEAESAHARGQAAEAICLGLLGLSSKAPDKTKKPLLQDCKSNSWD